MNILLKSMAVVSSLMAGLYAMEDAENVLNSKRYLDQAKLVLCHAAIANYLEIGHTANLELVCKDWAPMIRDTVVQKLIKQAKIEENLLSLRIPMTIEFINAHANQDSGLDMVVKAILPSSISEGFARLQSLIAMLDNEDRSIIGEEDDLALGAAMVPMVNMLRGQEYNADMSDSHTLLNLLPALKKEVTSSSDKESMYFTYWRKYNKLENKMIVAFKEALGIEDEENLPSIVTSCIDILSSYQRVDGEPMDALQAILASDMVRWEGLYLSKHPQKDDFFPGQ